MSGSRTVPNQIVSTALATLAIAALAGPAMAQVTSAEQSALRANCRSDFISHCSGVTPGGKDALVCLQKNVASLSANCQKVVRETLPKPAAPKAASAPAPAAAAPPKPAAATAPPPAAAKAPVKHETPTAAEKEALRKSCPSDFMAFCSSVAPGSKEALVCLQEHVAQLSGTCKKVVSETLGPPPAPAQTKAVHAAPAMPAPAPPAAPTAVGPTKQQLEAVKFACRRDFRRHCKGIPPGGPEALACLERNAARLTQNCKTSIAALALPAPAATAPPAPVIPVAKIEAMPLRERLVIFRTCDADAAALCPSVEAGGGRLIICLASHQNALSRRCRRTLGRAIR